METVRIYRLTGLRPRYQARLRAAQMEAAQVWTLCRDMHLDARQNRTSWPAQDDFHQATKGRFALHSQTVQAIFRTFLGTIETTRELRRTNRRHPLPLERQALLPAVLARLGSESGARARVALPQSSLLPCGASGCDREREHAPARLWLKD